MGRNKPDVLISPIKLVKRARKLRKDMSLPEVLLWVQLRKRPGGHKFRKQFPQAGLAIDFACVAARLAIEVDGEAHNRGDQPKFDQHRDAVLRERGFTVLRFPAREVFKNMDGVLTSIVSHCDAEGPLHHGASRRGPPPRAGVDFSADPPRNGEVAARSADGGGPAGGGELAANPADLRLGPLHHQPSAGGPPPRSREDFSADPPRDGEVARRSRDGGGPVGGGELAVNPADLCLGPLHHQPAAGGPPPRSGEDF